MDVFTRSENNLALINAFSQDIASDLIYPVFQAIFDLENNIVGYEILSRWNKYQGGEFVHILENESHQLYANLNILRLNDAIGLVNEFCTPDNKGSFFVSVNIGALMLLNNKYYTALTDVLNDSIHALSYIKFELTEQFNLNDPLLIERLLVIKRLGVRLSLDDFGIKFATIEALRLLPIDEVKIDRSFVKNIDRNIDDALFFDAMVKLVFIANKTIVVEGVETLSQLNLIRSCGCNYVQGYLLGRPVDEVCLRNTHNVIN
ncbi:MAG: EAL domain-containing protein [Alteromonadaceae bacterium]|nr:EAL domain-containing protein [Alteromonadaceae bacterium]